MGTSFHLLRPPFTSVRTTVGAGHTTLSIWVNHAKTGDIVLRNEEVPEVLLALSLRDGDDFRCAAHANSNGLRVNITLDPSTCLVSDYGEITTLAELRRESHA